MFWIYKRTLFAARNWQTQTQTHTASVAEWLRAWDTLTIIVGWVFHPDQVTGKVFSPEHALSFKILNLFTTLSTWGSSSYRPSAPFLYEVASHVKKNCHSGHYYYYRHTHVSMSAHLHATAPTNVHRSIIIRLQLTTISIVCNTFCNAMGNTVNIRLYLFKVKWFIKKYISIISIMFENEKPSIIHYLNKIMGGWVGGWMLGGLVPLCVCACVRDCARVRVRVMSLQ